MPTLQAEMCMVAASRGAVRRAESDDERRERGRARSPNGPARGQMLAPLSIVQAAPVTERACGDTR